MCQREIIIIRNPNEYKYFLHNVILTSLKLFYRNGVGLDGRRKRSALPISIATKPSQRAKQNRATIITMTGESATTCKKKKNQERTMPVFESRSSVLLSCGLCLSFSLSTSCLPPPWPVG